MPFYSEEIKPFGPIPQARDKWECKRCLFSVGLLTQAH